MMALFDEPAIDAATSRMVQTVRTQRRNRPFVRSEATAVLAAALAALDRDQLVEKVRCAYEECDMNPAPSLSEVCFILAAVGLIEGGTA